MVDGSHDLGIEGDSLISGMTEMNGFALRWADLGWRCMSSPAGH